MGHAKLNPFLNFDKTRFDIIGDSNLAHGSFASLEEAVAKIALQCALGFHGDRLLGEGSNQIVLEPEYSSLLVFCKYLVGHFNKGGNGGWSCVLPVHLDFLESNGVVDGFMFLSVGLRFDWLDKFTWRPRNEEPACASAGSKRDSFVFRGD